MNENAPAAIVLATCNGARFVDEQISSILGQSRSDFMLLVRDDGSSDGTLGIIKQRADARVRLLPDTKRKGVTGNFDALLTAAKSEPAKYFFLSDQDDVWLEDKLPRQLSLMRELERMHPGEPILVHSDLEVINERLETIAPSFMRFQGIRHEPQEAIKVLLAQNFVTGCTILVNRPLLELALPIPESVIIHDWWLALCAAACGHIGFIDAPLVKYRQHGSNTVGAKSIGRVLRSNWRDFWSVGMANFKRSVAQAGALQARIQQSGYHSPCLETIAAYASLLEQRPFARWRMLSRHGIHAQAMHRELLLRLRILQAKGTH